MDDFFTFVFSYLQDYIQLVIHKKLTQLPKKLQLKFKIING